MYCTDVVCLTLLIVCVLGRFGINCEHICHCYDDEDDCQMMDGECTTGCAQHFGGKLCQGNVLCAMNVVCLR